MSVIRCARALLVTPYKLRMANNWQTVRTDAHLDPGTSSPSPMSVPASSIRVSVSPM